MRKIGILWLNDININQSKIHQMKMTDVVIKEEAIEKATNTQSEQVISTENTAAALKPEPEKVPKINFQCANCSFTELCDYKGLHPPFAKKIQFHEECYVMQDPFSPPPGKLSDKSNSEYFIVIGSDCISCRNPVCAAGSCSIFYGRTFCLHCAYKSILSFPVEIQSKIRKSIASAQNG